MIDIHAAALKIDALYFHGYKGDLVKEIESFCQKVREDALEEAAFVSEKHDCMHCGHVGCKEKCLASAILSLKQAGREK